MINDLDLYPIDILQNKEEENGRVVTNLRYTILHYYNTEPLSYRNAIYTSFSPKINFKLRGFGLTGYHTVGGLISFNKQEDSTFQELQKQIIIQFKVHIIKGNSLSKHSDILYQEVINIPLLACLNKRAFNLNINKFEEFLKAEETYTLLVVFEEQNFYLNMLKAYS